MTRCVACGQELPGSEGALISVSQLYSMWGLYCIALDMERQADSYHRKILDVLAKMEVTDYSGYISDAIFVTGKQLETVDDFKKLLLKLNVSVA